MNEYSLFVAGLVACHADAHAERRPALGPADAVHAGQRHPVAVDVRRCLRRLRHRRRTATAASSIRPRPAARCPTSVEFGRGALDYKHRLEQHRAERRRRVATERRERLAAPMLGDPEQATLRAGYSHAYDRQGMARFTGQYGANPGSTLSLTRSDANGLLPAAAIRPAEPDAIGSYPQPFPAAPTLSDSGPRQSRGQHQHLPSRHQDRVRAVVDGQLPARALDATRRSTSATSARAASISGPRTTTTRTTTSSRTGSSTSSRLAMANLQANNAAGGTRAGSFAYFGPGSGTTPLPIYLAYFNGSRDVGNPARLLRRQLDQRDVRRPSRAATTRIRSTRPRIWTTTRRGATTRQSAGLSRELLRRQRRTPTTSFVWRARRSATTTRCRSSCGGGCRAGCRSTAAISTRSRAARRTQGRRYGRVMNPQRERAARDQDAVGLQRAGRPRPAVRRRT